MLSSKIVNERAAVGSLILRVSKTLAARGRRTMLNWAEPSQYEINHAKTSWQAQDNIDIQRVTQKAIIHELTQQQTQTIETVVPWFLDNMPSSYFRQIPEQFRMDHIKAISAIQDANMDLHMNLKTKLPDGRLILTYIRPGKHSGRLLNLVQHLPWNHNSEEYLPLSRVQVFTSEDDSMSLSMFVYGDEKRSIPTDIEMTGARILDFAKKLQTGEIGDALGPDWSPAFEREALIDYFQKCTESYIIRSNPRRFLKQKELFDKVSGTEDMAISVEESMMEDAAGDYWVDIAVANSLPQVALENASLLLFQHHLDVVRSHLDIVSDGDNGNVCILRMLVSPTQSADTISKETLKPLIRELKRTKWLDTDTMDLIFSKYPWLGVQRGEIITAFCSLLHPIMTNQNIFAFSRANIFNTITESRNIKHASAIADLFLERFNPHSWISDENFDAKCKEISARIVSDVEDTVTQELLCKMIDIVKYTLKTNIYLSDRYSLGLRLDPRVMLNNDNSNEVPYGVIFSHGRRFNAFHVRFRDIARGGMRLVTPGSPEQYALESGRHYDECYGLAYAQQLKNKDIPEGGSKAVNLINCNGLSDVGKQFVMRKSVKAFADTILDLVVDTEETRKHVVDFLGKKEVLYLGPDEQVTVEDINWIVKRAAKRGYDTPNAFMSSKPRAGINHKEYGVTSEGVNVFLDAALRHVLKIDPDQESFTLKMTGGPDGDVAGNEIKILIREYGENVKIVGIADHSGCAEDLDGLQHDELLRLVHNGLSISHFEKEKLGNRGTIHNANSEEGVKARNSMHNRLEADAFVPAGGRPNTIDITNYNNFLKEDGSPSSPLIVEGANLFVTSEARQKLFEEAGVIIVKDSSANKCGVITSSYEICAAMMLTDDEFFAHKEKIVDEVLEKLRWLSKMEAELLFKEFENYSGSLPDRSQIISNTINAATDALSNALNEMSENECEELMPLFFEHLPKTLTELAIDRVHHTVPEQYIKNAIASCIASKMVYKEGTKYIESLPKEKLASIALKYITKEKEIAQLKLALREIDMPESEKQSIITLLDAGGARTALNLS